MARAYDAFKTNCAVNDGHVGWTTGPRPIHGTPNAGVVPGQVTKVLIAFVDEQVSDKFPATWQVRAVRPALPGFALVKRGAGVEFSASTI
jgi:hypothetical protein